MSQESKNLAAIRSGAASQNPHTQLDTDRALFGDAIAESLASVRSGMATESDYHRLRGGLFEREKAISATATLMARVSDLVTTLKAENFAFRMIAGGVK